MRNRFIMIASAGYELAMPFHSPLRATGDVSISVVANVRFSLHSNIKHFTGTAFDPCILSSHGCSPHIAGCQKGSRSESINSIPIGALY